MKLNRRDVALLIIIIYFTFIGGTFYSQLNFFLRAGHQGVVTLLLGGWLAARLRRKTGLPATALDLPLAAWLLVSLVSALQGQSPRYSLEMMWFSLTHALAFYWLVDLMRQGRAAKLGWAFYMASAVVCLVGLAEFAAWYFGTPLFADFAQGWADIGGWRQPFPPFIYRLNITLNGSTPLAAYLALLIPPALGLILTLPRRSENRRALWLWLGLAIVVEILAFSRAGVLALAVSLALLAAGWLVINGLNFSSLTAWLRRPVTVLAVAGAGGAALFWLQRSFTNRAFSTGFRLTLWGAAMQIFQAEWLTGAGPANFGRALLRLNLADLPRQQIATAHSIYFNTAAELGLLGLLVGGWLFWATGRAWRQRWRQAADRAEQIRLMAAGAALVGLAAQTLVDTYPATPNMLVMLALVAWLTAGLRPAVHPPAVAALALAALLAYAGWFVQLDRADLHHLRSFNRQAAGNLTAAVAEAAQAQALDPALSLRFFRLAELEAALAQQTGDPADRAAAITHYRAGLVMEPILGLSSANLAGLLWADGQPAEAISLMRQSLAAEPAPLYRLNLGYFYEQSGDWPRALTAYGQALAASPGLAASGFWQATPERAGRWADITAAALQTVDGPEAALNLRAQWAQAQGDFETIITLLGASPPADDGQRVMLAGAYLSQNHPEMAEPLLGNLPRTAADYWLRGRFRLLPADPTGAETGLKTAVFWGDRRAYYELGQWYEQQGNPLAAETAYRRGFTPHAVSENIAVNIYGRTGGQDMGPQLLRIGLGPETAKSWLALAGLYVQQQRFEEARQVCVFLLREDPFLTAAQQQLEALPQQ